MNLTVKICCIKSLAEANLAIKYGASMIGLVGKMPSGPGIIADNMIYEIATSISPSISTFLLTSETKAANIIAHILRTHTDTIQLVDRVEVKVYDEIRIKLPKIKLVQVIHVINDNSIEEALKVSPYVDAILLDSGNPNLQVKELGGTGRVHNWELSKIINEKVNVPVYLAGGLNAKNIKKAIETVKPFGVDLCSSIRTNGLLDEQKLKEFFEALHDTSY